MEFPVAEERKIQERSRIFSIITFCIFFALIGRLWFLQVVRGERYEMLSEGNRVRLVTVPAPRGKFLDRDGEVLVSSRMAFCISILPSRVGESDKILKDLSGILGVSEAELKARFDAQNRNRRPFEPIRLKMDVAPTTVIRIEERRPELPGVIIEELPVRNYVYGEFASHLFGYVGEVSKQDLEQFSEQGYRPGDIVGKTGLERLYETYLHGKDGGQQIEINALMRPIRVLGSKDPVPGDNLVLTIDRDIQKAAEDALSEAIKKLSGSGSTRNARAGAVVALDPRNGEILAMVSRPGFDPNEFVKGITPERWKELNSRLSPQTNRVTSATYPPGSAFKAVTLAAALEEGKTSPDEFFYCRGRDPRSGKACWIWKDRRRGHGRESLLDGVANSCNVVFYELARRVGIDMLSKYAREFGFGRKTGLEIFPDEKAGLVPDREWKRKNYRGENRIWYPDETLDVGIGQGALTVTPLQVATAYMAIANGGTLYVPRVVKRIMSADGEVVFESQPEVAGHVTLRPDTWQAMKEGLRRVVASGTASGAFRRFPIPVAGKTGTAQAPPGPSHAWFVGFAPVDNPEIVVVAFVERGASGSAAAAPIARKVLEAYFSSSGRSEER